MIPIEGNQLTGCEFHYRSLREEGEGRLPLRDAVEKRPISLIDRDVAFKTVEVNYYFIRFDTNKCIKFRLTLICIQFQDVEPVSDDDTFVELKKFYGAASYLNKYDILRF